MIHLSPAITWKTSHPPRDRQFDPGFGHSLVLDSSGVAGGVGQFV